MAEGRQEGLMTLESAAGGLRSPAPPAARCVPAPEPHASILWGRTLAKRASRNWQGGRRRAGTRWVDLMIDSSRGSRVGLSGKMPT